MNGSTHLSTWVSVETKQRFGALAGQLGLSESALLKRLVDLNLQCARGVESAAVPAPPVKLGRNSRLYVRLRSEDHLILRERAAGRAIAAATYASFVLRAHLRATVPIPDRELAELKRSVAALGLVGRNLNQIARVANQTGVHHRPDRGGPPTASARVRGTAGSRERADQSQHRKLGDRKCRSASLT